MTKKNSASKTPATPAAAEAAAVAAPVVDAWTGFITPFANAIGKEVNVVTQNLKSLVGDAGDQAISLLQDEELTPLADISEALKMLSVPKAVLTKAVKGLRTVAAAVAGASGGVGAAMMAYDSILPSVPEDISFLEMLRTGGILKPGVTEVIAAIRAGLADRLGLYALPAELVKRMEKFAESQDEPCGADYYKLKKVLARRNYAEIFAALEIDGASVTQVSKTQLLGKLSNIWVALTQFNQLINGWIDAWQKGMSNPAMLFQAIASLGAGRGAMAPGLMAPPVTTQVRAGAEAFIDKVNRVFSGTGIVTARALAFDALKVKEVLENPALPAQIGATNREQMLKSLGVGVSSDLVLLERNLTRFTLGIIELPKVTSGEAEVAYISALYSLGQALPWDELQSLSSRRRGSTLHDPEVEDDDPAAGSSSGGRRGYGG